MPDEGTSQNRDWRAVVTELSPQRHDIRRTVLAGLGGAVVFVILQYTLFGLAGPILDDPNLQSAKLTAVWNEIEPLPPAYGYAATVAGLALIGIGRAFVYRWLAPAWPNRVVARALRYALLIWFLSFLFVEFSAPFTLFGEPAGLLALELVILGVAVLGEAFVLAAIMEFRNRRSGGADFHAAAGR
jgi:hypothetical protein